MTDSTTIAREIYESTQRLEKASSVLFVLAKEWAEAERDYRIALAKETVRLKDEKMNITLVPDIARGNTAELKFQRDLAEARYRAGIYSVDAIKSQMTGLQTIIKFQSEI